MFPSAGHYIPPQDIFLLLMLYYGPVRSRVAEGEDSFYVHRAGCEHVEQVVMDSQKRMIFELLGQEVANNS